MLNMRKNYFDFDLFDDVFSDPFFSPRPRMHRGNGYKELNAPNGLRRELMASSLDMKTDIEKKDNGYELSMDLPGFDKKDITVEVKNGYLTISAVKSEEKEEKDKEGKNFVHRERFYGKSTRSFYIGSGVKQDDIKAAYNDGVLKLNIPEAEEEKKKLISVE